MIVPRSFAVPDEFPFPILTPRQAKGLEFDHVVVVEPAGDRRTTETAAYASSTSRSRARRRRSSSSTRARCPSRLG